MDDHKDEDDPIDDAGIRDLDHATLGPALAQIIDNGDGHGDLGGGTGDGTGNGTDNGTDDDNDIGSMDVRNPSHTIDNDFFYIKGRPPQMTAHLHALHHTARQAVGACATPRRPRWATYTWNSKRSKRLIDYGDAGVLSSKAGFRLVEAPSAAAP